MTNLEKIIQYMVKNSVNGVYKGNPRKFMESLGGSGGSYYTKLYEMGFEKVGRDKKAEWTIPQAILREYGEKK